MSPLAEAATSGPDLLPSMVGALLRIACVLIVLGGVAWALMRWQAKRGGPRRDLQIVDRAALTRGASVVLLDVDNRRLLVGASEAGVRLIADLGDEPAKRCTREFDSVLGDVTGRKRQAG